LKFSFPGEATDQPEVAQQTPEQSGTDIATFPWFSTLEVEISQSLSQNAKNHCSLLKYN
jgi:hypothetical protein